jgi:hypothetical protein
MSAPKPCASARKGSSSTKRKAASMPRVPSEQLLKTASLVRTESSKHLLQHISMIASGAQDVGSSTGRSA